MKITLVSDDKNLSEILEKKLLFLRKDDEINFTSYQKAVQNIELSSPNIVLVHEASDRENTISLIRELKNNKNICIILLTNSKDSEFILRAIDSGADDFILSSAENFEFVIRIVNYIRLFSYKKAFNRNYKILEQLNVINNLTGIYENSYAKQVIENYIDLDLITKGSFMAVAPSKTGKANFSIEELANSIKVSIRNEDIVTHGKGTKFYIFMPNTDFNGANCVLKKIKEKIKFDICAGISDITENKYDKFEKKALKALNTALATNTAIIFEENEQKETLDEWLQEDNAKNYKIFRHVFYKKLEKVITPVFYRLQKIYEEKLFDTEIEQYVNEDQCVFNIRNKKFFSSLKIIYSGFTKITISITHDGLDSPENREIKLQLDKITQDDIVEIIEDFVKEFKSRG